MTGLTDEETETSKGKSLVPGPMVRSVTAAELRQA